jgi:hypothetical protein
MKKQILYIKEEHDKISDSLDIVTIVKPANALKDS